MENIATWCVNMLILMFYKKKEKEGDFEMFSKNI